MTPAAVSQYEAGANRPSSDTLLRLDTGCWRCLGALPRCCRRPRSTRGSFARCAAPRWPTAAGRGAIALVAHDIARAAGDVLPGVAMPEERPVALDASRGGDRTDCRGASGRTLGLPPGPAGPVVPLLESRGAVVIRLPLDTADVDAFSLPFRDRPVIVLGFRQERSSSIPIRRCPRARTSGDAR